MPTVSTSLALASLGWCARGLAPETTTDDLIRRLSALDGGALAPISQLALREAVQELLDAVANADDGIADQWLECIRIRLPDRQVLARLDALLGGTPEEWRCLLDAEDGDERGVVVAARLLGWLRAIAAEASEPPSLEDLLIFGWPAPGCTESRMDFYRAYCLSLHDAVCSSMQKLEPVLLGARLEPQQWFEWLGIEVGLPPLQIRRPRSIPAPERRTMASIMAVVAMAIAGIFWFSSRPHAKRTSAEPPKAAADIPVVVPAVEGPGVTLSGTPAPAIPSEEFNTNPADPLERAKALLTRAKGELEADAPEAADVDAKMAQELIEGLLPVHDVNVGEALKEVADHWESRGRWPEAVRVLQRSVQCYEQTPAENTGPQLDAVNRWAGALRKTGRLIEAERLYRTLLKAYEGSGPALEVVAATVAHNLANALVDGGRFADARGFYERALSLLADHWPTEDEAQRLAGVMGQNYQECLVTLGIPKNEAVANARRLLKLTPSKGEK